MIRLLTLCLLAIATPSLADECHGDAPTSCLAAMLSGEQCSGIYTIHPIGSDPIKVYCDMTSHGGGWMVFQRREDGSESFEVPMDNYNAGFGELDREFWLGNDALKKLTEGRRFDLVVDMVDWNDEHAYAEYKGFSVSGDDYTLNFDEESYCGNAGDSLSFHRGSGFTAVGHDVDGAWGGSCADWLHGGWWYAYCHRANPNGLYITPPEAEEGERDQGIQWVAWKGFNYSLKKIELKIRPES